MPLQMPRLISLLATLSIVSGGVTASPSSDWPQWRGPTRDGALRASTSTAPGAGLPAAWPEKLTAQWSVKVGEGHASPVTSGDIIYMHTREGEEEVARALRLADGSALWRQAWPAPYAMHMAARGHGKGPKATPVLAEGRLFTLGIEGTLTAFDAASGATLWRRGFSDEFKATSPRFGSASSPIVEGGRVIAFVGGHHDGALMAFEVKTGKTVWSLKGDGPGYASAVITDLGGARQIVTQSDQRILGVAVADGRLLWSLPFTTPYDQNAVTPLVHGDLLIVSGLEQGIVAYRFRLEGASLIPQPVWNRKDLSLYMSSPVAAGERGGRLYGFSPSKRGHLFGIEAATGTDIWHAKGSGSEHASLLLLGPWLLSLVEGGELSAGRPDGAEWKPVVHYTVANTPSWAHPVPVPSGLLVKDRNSLTRWSWPESLEAMTSK